MVFSSYIFILFYYIFTMSKFKWLSPDIQNLHEEIIQENQFCLWKYKLDSAGKKQKIPLVIGSDGRPSYTFPKGNFLNFTQLRNYIGGEIKPGLYLKDGKLSVIDIDNYTNINDEVNNCLVNLFTKGCYIEISPSKAGLHIFYSGSYDWTNGRKRSTSSVISKDGSKSNCEVYNPDDVRFITLTGHCLFHPDLGYDYYELPSAEDIMPELLILQKLFFPISKNKSSSTISSNNVSQSSDLLPPLKKIQLLNKRKKNLQYVYDIVKQSLDYKKFVLFTEHSKFEKHTSISETDMAFAGFLVRHIPQAWSENDKIEVIAEFFKSYRPSREKYSERTDYLTNTANNALKNTTFLSEKKEKIIDNDLVQKKTKISCSSILKMCNIMNIFHLGRSFSDFNYINDKKSDNSLKVNCAESLTTTDFKYFMQILFQYREWYDENKEIISKNDLCEININRLIQQLGLTSGGRAFQRFFDSLDKLSRVRMEYNKLLDPEKNLYCKSVDLLLSYQLHYTKNENDTSKIRDYKKLKIKMHPLMFDMMSKAKYNYSLLNKNSFNHLSSEKLQLLYYHFCQNTWPGKGYTTFTAKELLKLWPPSENSRTLTSRQKDLNSLIREFMDKKSKISDLLIEALYDGENLINVKVKKNNLTPV